MNKDIEDRVKTICAEHLGVNASEITSDSRFTEDLGGDSLDAIELVMAFEEDFNIEIPDAEAENISTVGKATEYISARLS